MIKNIIILVLVILLAWTFISLDVSEENTEIIGENEEISEVINQEEILPEKEELTSPLMKQAKTYCNESNIVYVSEGTIKVTSNIPGAGSSYYSLGETKSYNCPVVAPDSMSEECKEIITKETNWIEICKE